MFDFVAYLTKQHADLSPKRDSTDVLKDAQFHLNECWNKRRDGPPPSDWIDLILLACEGALVSGYTPTDIVRSLEARQGQEKPLAEQLAQVKKENAAIRAALQGMVGELDTGTHSILAHAAFVRECEGVLGMYRQQTTTNADTTD